MEYGKIVSVNPGKRTTYQVKLDSGELITVVQNVIEPLPAKMLKVGCRLAVRVDKHKSVWASTDLSSIKKAERKNISQSPVKTSLNPTRLGIYNHQNKPNIIEKSIKIEREPAVQSVTVVEYDSRRGHVYVQAQSGRRIKIYLPTSNVAWTKIFISREFQLETEYSFDGVPSYNLVIQVEDLTKEPFSYHDGIRDRIPKKRKRASYDKNADHKTPKVKPASTAQIQKPPRLSSVKIDSNTHPPQSQATQGKSTSITTIPKEEKESDKSERIKVDRIGIDPAYYQEREKENHRYEIMAFVRNHFTDELIEWWKVYDEKAARYSDPAAPLAKRVQRAIYNQDVKKLYSHQAYAFDAIQAGKNLVIITPTASGKTLCYNPAIFEHIITSDPSAHALYIFPLNALKMDQKEKIDQLTRALLKDGIDISSELLVKNLPAIVWNTIATNPPNLLVTNPELLSLILNNPEKYQSFFAGLKYVIVDEVHSYRGILGMHTAGLLRRLLLITRRLHVEPQFILSSATVSNPLDLVVRLTSLPKESFQLLGEKDDGSFQAAKHWFVLNPEAHNSDGGYDNYLYTAAFAMIELISSRDKLGKPSPLNTILFAKSIRDVKKIHKIVKDNLGSSHPELVRKVDFFTANDLSSEKKREIYDGLKNGELVGVVSSNALEAGIDIGKLDACIIAGFPFWVMRLKQMAGRVGRLQEGVVLFVPHPGKSVDEYYRAEPELLHDQAPEAFVVDPENPYITRKHINAAAYSLKGITDPELAIFGKKSIQTVKQAINDRVMSKTNGRYAGTNRSYKNPRDPYAISGMRSTQQIPYAVCRLNEGRTCSPGNECFSPDSKAGCEARITVVDQPQAYRECHPGAIYEAGDGKLFQVVSFDDAGRIIQVKEIDEKTLERTFAEEITSIEVLGDPLYGKNLSGGSSLYVGDVKVTQSFIGYYTYKLKPVRRCLHCKISLDQVALICPRCHRKTAKFFDQTKPVHHDFPPHYQEKGFTITLRSVACWLTIPTEMEGLLEGASPCKLLGKDNHVLKMLSEVKNVDQLTKSLPITAKEKESIDEYIKEISQQIQVGKSSKDARDILVFPGVYQQCLLSHLRKTFNEGKSLDLFASLTQYPVTDNLRHVCRKCQTSVLLPAMHTVEHTVLMRYPSVALGDPTDLVSYTTLGHPYTGKPTIFWYDNYEGGLGAAEKVYEQIELLLQYSQKTLTNCSCRTMEGCPNCTQIGHCDRDNQALSKPAAQLLIAQLLGNHYDIPSSPFIYPGSKEKAFDNQQEYVKVEHGIGEEKPSSAQRSAVEPNLLLRLQNLVHACVLAKAYEVRSEEITNEIPAISASELTHAFNEMRSVGLLQEWQINPNQSAYQTLEVLPDASKKMVHQIYRVLALELHPDRHPNKRAWAEERMKMVNKAYSEIRDKQSNHEEYTSDY